MFCVLYRNKDTGKLRTQDCYSKQFADCLREIGHEVLDVKPITWEQHICYDWREMLFNIFGITPEVEKQPVQQEFDFN